MNIKFQAHRLQKAHEELIDARDNNDEMMIEVYEREIKMRKDMIETAGYKVFADEHDVMLVA
jgi:nitrogenase molybdenum-iron protein alpha/beta subunit